MAGPLIPQNPLDLIKQQLGLSGASGPLQQLPLNNQENGGLLSPGPTTSAFEGPATGLGATDDGGGIFQKILQVLMNPAVQQTGGAIASAVKGPRDLRSFQRQTALNQQGASLRSQEERAGRGEARAERESLATSTQQAKEEIRRLATDSPLTSLEEAKTGSPELFERAGKSGEAIYRAAQNKASRALEIENLDLLSRRLDVSTGTVSKLASILIDPDAELPANIQALVNSGGISPETISRARDLARELEGRRDLDDRAKKAQILKSLLVVAAPGSSIGQIDEETGRVPTFFQLPTDRAPTSSETQAAVRAKILEQVQNGTLTESQAEFLSTGNFGNTALDDAELILKATSLVITPGVEPDDVIEGIRAVLASLGRTDLAAKLPEVFSKGIIFKDRSLRPPPGSPNSEIPRATSPGQVITGSIGQAIVNQIKANSPSAGPEEIKEEARRRAKELGYSIPEAQ